MVSPVHTAVSWLSRLYPNSVKSLGAYDVYKPYINLVLCGQTLFRTRGAGNSRNLVHWVVKSVEISWNLHPEIRNLLGNQSRNQKSNYPCTLASVIVTWFLPRVANSCQSVQPRSCNSLKSLLKSRNHNWNHMISKSRTRKLCPTPRLHQGKGWYMVIKQLVAQVFNLSCKSSHDVSNGNRQSKTCDFFALVISISTVFQLMTQDTPCSAHFSRF